MQHRIAHGYWAVDDLPHSPVIATVELLQYSAAPPGGDGQWESLNTSPVRLETVASGTLAVHYLIQEVPHSTPHRLHVVW